MPHPVGAEVVLQMLVFVEELADVGEHDNALLPKPKVPRDRGVPVALLQVPGRENAAGGRGRISETKNRKKQSSDPPLQARARSSPTAARLRRLDAASPGDLEPGPKCMHACPPNA